VIPIEKWSDLKTSLEHPRTFGCIMWAHILDDKRKRLVVKIHVDVMMGYFEYLKSYRLFDPIK
jgi:hypothetical protein